jgi:5-methyltetrahydrofolate--homocysteine methyltransferase
MAINQALFDAVCKGKREDVIDLVTEAVDRDDSAVEILMDSMIPAMRDIGDRFARNEVYVPEMLIAARAMQAGMDIIEPILIEAGHEPLAKVAIGTVKGDLHDIGKNLVGMMLKGAGYEVMDLGVDCSIEEFQGAIDQGAQAICCSALLTTTMPYMKELVESETVKVIIGGAPVTEAYADQIGAHGYSDNASGAVTAVASSLGIAT